MSVLGNDLFEDEFVKSPYMKKEMEKEIISHSKHSKKFENTQQSAETLAHNLANNLVGFPNNHFLQILFKFFHFSNKRR